MPENNNLKLLAACAVVSNHVSAYVGDTVVNTETNMTFTINKANMKYMAKLYLNKDMSDVDLAFMITKFGANREVHLKEFFKAVLLRKVVYSTSTHEIRYHNSVRYKPYHGRGVCAICGKTLALTNKGVLRLHKCI